MFFIDFFEFLKGATVGSQKRSCGLLGGATRGAKGPSQLATLYVSENMCFQRDQRLTIPRK